MLLHIAVDKLTHFETAPDGGSVHIHMEDVTGRLVALSLPIDCVNSLMMTLPKMMATAIQRRHRDPSLRLTFPLESFRVEPGSDRSTRILTLSTRDGFTGSFAVGGEVLRAIGSAVDGPWLIEDQGRPN